MFHVHMYAADLKTVWLSSSPYSLSLLQAGGGGAWLVLSGMVVLVRRGMMEKAEYDEGDNISSQ